MTGRISVAFYSDVFFLSFFAVHVESSATLPGGKVDVDDRADSLEARIVQLNSKSMITVDTAPGAQMQ